MSDYFNHGARRRGTSSANENLVPRLPAGAIPSSQQPPARRPLTSGGSRENFRTASGLRIRRLPSSQSVQQQQQQQHQQQQQQQQQQQSRPTSQRTDEADEAPDATGRRRSMSAPQRFGSSLTVPGPDTSGQSGTGDAHMQTIKEGAPLNQPRSHSVTQQGYPTTQSARGNSTLTGATDAADHYPQLERVGTADSGTTRNSNNAPRARGIRRLRSNTAASRQSQLRHDEYDSEVVDLLDLIDPEVSTIGTLTNVQNSLFVPDLGSFLNRRPTYDLTRRTEDPESIPAPRSRAATRASQRPHAERLPTIAQTPSDANNGDVEMRPQPRRTGSLDSQMSDTRYAVLPHGVSLEDWSEEDIDELNDHVRHLLHSRREGFKRSMKGFRQYISHPLGLFVFVYATLVTLFGAAWVFCLIGWIYIGNEQSYFIDVIDNVLVALFALIGDGMAPFRAVDTYHMCFIAHYHHLTWRLRQEKALPDLVDHNDLPDRNPAVGGTDDFVDKEETAEFSVLTALQQKRLQYHQAKFSKAHTFYKPHETATHHAFPLRLLVAVVVLLDCHSMFQVALGSCTWSINYKVRPQSLTATILSCSIACNIMAGVLISIGDHRTRKKDVLERIFRQGLTEEAIRHVRKKHDDDGEVPVDLDVDAAVEDAADGSAAPKSKEFAEAAEHSRSRV